MPTNQRLTQEPVEVTHAGSQEQRLTQQSVELLHGGSESQRVTQLVVEVLTAETTLPVLRVTQTGAQTIQVTDGLRVTQTAATTAQQAGDVRVTQIGLYIIYREGEEPPPPEEDVCVIELPSAQCWGDGDPTIQALAETPTVTKGGAIATTPSVVSGEGIETTARPSKGATWGSTHSPDIFRVGLIGDE